MEKSPEKNSKRPPRIAVVIGSGGLKTIGCVELFDFLDKKNIHIDILVGSSGGSIFAVMHAMGYSANKMKKIFFEYLGPHVFESIDYLGGLMLFLNVGNKTFPSLLKGKPFKQALNEIFQDIRIENLPIKTIIQATCFDTGEEIYIEKGAASEAVYASSTVVPIFPMIEMNDKKLIDGGYTNSLPITTALNRNADIIIAIGFSEKVDQAENIFDETTNFINKVSRENRSWRNLVELDYQNYHEIVIVDVAFDRAIPWSNLNNIDLIHRKSKEAVEQSGNQIESAIASWYQE
jgi:NTE family protein